MTDNERTRMKEIMEEKGVKNPSHINIWKYLWSGPQKGRKVTLPPNFGKKRNNDSKS